MTLLEERTKMREDLLCGKVPKRIPVFVALGFEAACPLADVELIKAHYDMGLVEKAYTKACEAIYSDSFPCGNLRMPAVYQQLGAQNWVLGSRGVVQHPEIETMRADEYDALINDPYGFIVETLLPRVCTALRDPVAGPINMAKAYATYNQMLMAQGPIIGKLKQQYEYVPGITTGAIIEAPFDFIADQLRGFKGINMDVRRQPEKVKAACEAVLPLMIKRGAPNPMRPGVCNFVPLHLAPFISDKTFADLYWPTFEKLLVELDKKGVACYIYAEGDFTRYADYLARLPESTVISFEDGDYKLLKKVVGKNHVISGFIDPTITLTRSKEACIDEVKRHVDVLGDGGRYWFSFDKGLMDLGSFDLPKVAAMLEWVRDNTNY